jgi:hypothetical protein
MPEGLGDNLRVNTRCEQGGGVAVAQIVKPQAGEPDPRPDSLHRVREGVRLHRSPIAPFTYKACLLPGLPEHEAPGSLIFALSSQSSHSEAREGDGPTRALRLLGLGTRPL